jgi:hypothetical protein
MNTGPQRLSLANSIYRDVPKIESVTIAALRANGAPNPRKRRIKNIAYYIVESRFYLLAERAVFVLSTEDLLIHAIIDLSPILQVVCEAF